MLRQEHVIVAEEDGMGTDIGSADELYPLLDQGLSRLVRRMGLARKDELHRSLWIG